MTHLSLQVSDIPYASKFGGAGNVDMKLSEYIDEVRSMVISQEQEQEQDHSVFLDLE
jgi:hypothetical protein